MGMTLEVELNAISLIPLPEENVASLGLVALRVCVPHCMCGDHSLPGLPQTSGGLCEDGPFPSAATPHSILCACVCLRHMQLGVLAAL